jgi:endoglucanase Acf2
MKTFKVAQVRDLINQVFNEKMTFSRFVEILNEQADGKRKFDIKLIENSEWVKWMEEHKDNGLQEHDLSKAIREIYQKVNEIIGSLNAI